MKVKNAPAHPANMRTMQDVDFPRTQRTAEYKIIFDTLRKVAELDYSENQKQHFLDKLLDENTYSFDLVLVNGLNDVLVSIYLTEEVEHFFEALLEDADMQIDENTAQGFLFSLKEFCEAQLAESAVSFARLQHNCSSGMQHAAQHAESAARAAAVHEFIDVLDQCVESLRGWGGQTLSASPDGTIFSSEAAKYAALPRFNQLLGLYTEQDTQP